ncbi:MAG: energy-coupling factor ABC transporter ATP-binding protein [Spirochaetaceae bacterium]|nr:energy-coupling factor ABC transporter ATP-binding protein [Spirochaetaceae bacterium]
MTAIRLSHISKVFPVLDDADDAENNANGAGGGGLFRALDDVCLDIEQGTCTVISGANGSGKSLLMAIIAGLENQSAGEREVRGKVGLVFQDADSQILGETPREDVAVGVRLPPFAGKKAAAPIVEKALSETGLLHRADFPSRFLSGGEKRRLAVAGVLAMNVETIIFDEPYANLDYGGVVQTNTVIKELRARNKTLVILTHELEKCLAFAENFAVLFKGKIVFCGTPEEGLRHPLEQWSIRHPLRPATRSHAPCASIEDLCWL